MRRVQLIFPQGEIEQRFTVGIINDTLVEQPETISIVLTNPTPAGLGLENTTTLTIISDDSVIRFQTATYSQNENAVSGTAPIVVIREGATNSSATIDYSTQTGTAGNQDFQAVSGTLVFAPGRDE